MPGQDWLLTVVLVEVALIAAFAAFSILIAALGRARRRARTAAPAVETPRLVAASA